MGRQEALCLTRRFEPAHDLLPFTCWAMGVLNPVIQALVSAMISIWRKSPNRLGVIAQFVCHHDPGFAVLRDQRAKETSGCPGIPTRLNQDVEHVSIPVNLPPEPVFQRSPLHPDAICYWVLDGPGECSAQNADQTGSPICGLFPY